MNHGNISSCTRPLEAQLSCRSVAELATRSSCFVVLWQSWPLEAAVLSFCGRAGTWRCSSCATSMGTWQRCTAGTAASSAATRRSLFTVHHWGTVTGELHQSLFPAHNHSLNGAACCSSIHCSPTSKGRAQQRGAVRMKRERGRETLLMELSQERSWHQGASLPQWERKSYSPWLKCCSAAGQRLCHRVQMGTPRGFLNLLPPCSVSGRQLDSSFRHFELVAVLYMLLEE
jgi:hypothetical protein